MIADANTLGGGGLGGNFRPQSTRDTRMLERAIKQRWPIPEEYRQPVVERMYKIASDEKSKAREATIAARVLVAMEQQNQADELKAIDKHLPDLHEVSGSVEHQITVKDLLTEPGYVEYCRESEVDSEPSAIARTVTRGTANPWMMARHVMAIDRELHDLAAGRNNKLIIQMPPRHGKSELCSKYFPAWYLGTFPERNVILTSATDDLAMDFSVSARDLLAEFGGLFGTSLRADRASAQRWGTNRGGGLRAAGVGGAIMGRGADLLIIDDYFRNIEEALSETIRRKMYQWYLTTSRTRLSPTGAQVIIATRWHYNDLIGEVLKTAALTGEKWRTVCFPAIGDDGAALWPEQWPRKLLDETKAGYYDSGYPWMWEALYQQIPPETIDSEWPPEYFADIWCDEWPTERLICVVALDPSLGESEKSDYSAFVAVAKGHDGKYYVDADISRRPSSQMVDHGVDWMCKIKPDAFGVEKQNFQRLLLPLFEREIHRCKLTPADVFGIANNSRGSSYKDQKVVRIRDLTSLLAKGQIKVRRSPGSSLLVEQLKGFPNHKHDDGPDALEMGIRFANLLLAGAHYEPEPEVMYA